MSSSIGDSALEVLIDDSHGKAQPTLLTSEFMNWTRSVCRIKIRDPEDKTQIKVGSCFLAVVRPKNLQDETWYGLFTNEHVVSTTNVSARDTVHCSFEKYNEDSRKFVAIQIDIEIGKDAYSLLNSKDLDATFLRFMPDLQKRFEQHNRQFLAVTAGEITALSEWMVVYTVQYPQGGAQQFSIGAIVGIDEPHIYHSCSTENGSSGSPVINVDGQVVGLHKWGDMAKNENGGTAMCHIMAAMSYIGSHQLPLPPQDLSNATVIQVAMGTLRRENLPVELRIALWIYTCIV